MNSRELINGPKNSLAMKSVRLWPSYGTMPHQWALYGS